MRTLKFFVLTVMMAVATGANAQGKMRVTLKNGTESAFAVNDIDRMEWTDGDGDDASGNVDKITADIWPVDLGLSSGTKWANCNLGATSPDEYGDFFAWGETKGYNSGKREFSSSTYSFYDITTKGYTKYNSSDNITVLESVDDAAYANWGGSWRLPTKAEVEELILSCTWTWTSISGTLGCQVKGPNGNSIFLPAAGMYLGKDHECWSSVGMYWTSSRKQSDPYYFEFYKSKQNVDTRGRNVGLSIRPVCR